ncbi:MAG TPA: DUF1697 domain-containing protein [bacterium]|nr:DUF1697 domain-containing protein [bacterium]
MTIWIAFVRGINMGGHHKLPMKALIALLKRLGCGDVHTYIQSGNVVFRHAQAAAAPLARSIRTAIREAHGFEPLVLLLTREQLERAAAANPFPQAVAQPSSLALFFLSHTPERPDLSGLERIKGPTEAIALEGTTLYFHAPDGFGRSKLPARVETLLGVEATARNWRTVTAVLELAWTLE